MQLKWSRTVNMFVTILQKKVSSDLHMEHLNRECKNAISGLDANVTDNSIKRVGDCLGRLQSTLHQFDSVNGIKQGSGSHTCHSTATDMNRIIQQLTQSSVLELKGTIQRAPRTLRMRVISVCKLYVTATLYVRTWLRCATFLQSWPPSTRSFSPMPSSCSSSTCRRHRHAYQGSP